MAHRLLGRLAGGKLAGKTITALVLVALAGWNHAVHAGGTQQGMAHKHMVASANPYATEAGLEILRAGGSAVDAAIAVQLVLGLVEPQSSGIGGGAFLLVMQPGDTPLKDRITAYDGRETAPASATPELFLNPDGSVPQKSDAMPGGRSVGVPGVFRMLAMAHGAYGKLPWADLFKPAIKLARQGFVVSPRLHFLISSDPHLKKFPGSLAYFFDANGAPLPVGTTLVNTAYGETLETVATGGADAFYEGDIAADIVDAARNAPINPGLLTLDDMKAYSAKTREVICAPYRLWTVCGMPPPSSGGVAVLQTLSILQRFDLKGQRPDDPATAHLVAEALRLAYADRATWLADTDFVDVPLKGLLDKNYLAQRAAMIMEDKVMPDAPAGMPPGATQAFNTVEPGEIPATSHFSITDQWGQVIAMTTSVENAFGSRILVRGFLLNNQLTDFSLDPLQDGVLVANAPAGGKRPLSSMSPTIAERAGDGAVLSIGSPGGPLIISFVAKSIVGMVDGGLALQQAIELPNFVPFNGRLFVERGSSLWQQADVLRGLGYEVMEGGLTSGLHGVIRLPLPGGLKLDGGADPRREGTVAGD